MKRSKSTVLVVVAHADDETIGLGGTIARHAAEGDDVFVLVLADGETSRGQIQDELVARRNGQCRAACNVLGVKDVYFEALPDNAMDSRPRLEIARICETHIANVKPDTIYTHHRGDVNIDHVYTSDAVTIAARAQPHCPVRRILHFETASSTEWQLPAHDHPFSPNWFVEISDYWSQKVSALEEYKDEMRDFPHSRSIEALEACAKWRGATAGVRKAEAFMLVRQVA